MDGLKGGRLWIRRRMTEAEYKTVDIVDRKRFEAREAAAKWGGGKGRRKREKGG
jgi:hypothetical protein